MYLKKIDGPRAVTLPDGQIMTLADLPSEDEQRWVASRKAAVVRAVQHRLLSKAAALERYSISKEEFDEWKHAVESHGESALKATAVQRYRQL